MSDMSNDEYVYEDLSPELQEHFADRKKQSEAARRRIYGETIKEPEEEPSA